MRVNPYYNKDTMNLKQLASDLEKQAVLYVDLITVVIL